MSDTAAITRLEVTRPMSRAELDALVLRVSYFGHLVVVGEHPDGFWVQMKYLEPDVESRDDNPKAEWQSTRKWLVSRWSTPGEVFQTLLKCALTSAEHRVREHFLVDGVRVYGPHMDVEKLIAFVRDNDESHRK